MEVLAVVMAQVPRELVVEEAMALVRLAKVVVWAVVRAALKEEERDPVAKVMEEVVDWAREFQGSVAAVAMAPAVLEMVAVAPVPTTAAAAAAVWLW